MDSKRIRVFVICFLLAFIFTLLLMYAVCYKPSIETITDQELNAIQGVSIEWINGIPKHGKRARDIKIFIARNPNCTVEDLRVIKGVDDMIIDQLKKRFR